MVPALCQRELFIDLFEFFRGDYVEITGSKGCLHQASTWVAPKACIRRASVESEI